MTNHSVSRQNKSTWSLSTSRKGVYMDLSMKRIPEHSNVNQTFPKAEENIRVIQIE